MIPVDNENTNAVFVAEGYEDLPAVKCHDDDGIDYVETCWEMSDAELHEVMKTKRIYISTVGRTVVPMAVEVRSMIEDGKNQT